MEKLVARFLSSFFQLFQCYIQEIKISDGKAEGVVCFEDLHDIQPFVWNYNHYTAIDDTIENTIENATVLVDTLRQEKIIYIDKIIVTEEEVKKLLYQKKWSDKDILNSIRFLLNVRVNMVDDGEVTDSFFLHF